MEYTRDDVIENLCDCACSEDYIDQFMRCYDKGELKRMYRLFLEKRDELLAQLHECRANIDRLDYLEYRLRQEDKVS